MTTCPAAVKPVPVSRTPGPVSVTADVAVKKAWSGETELPSGAENGISSKKVPSAMRLKNPTDTRRAGFCVRSEERRVGKEGGGRRGGAAPDETRRGAR